MNTIGWYQNQHKSNCSKRGDSGVKKGLNNVCSFTSGTYSKCILMLVLVCFYLSKLLNAGLLLGVFRHREAFSLDLSSFFQCDFELPLSPLT